MNAKEAVKLGFADEILFAGKKEDEPWATAGSNNAVSGTGNGSESTGVVIRSEESLSFTCRWCSELATVESTKYRIVCEGKTYNIIYVNPMGFKHNSIKFSCELEGQS